MACTLIPQSHKTCSNLKCLIEFMSLSEIATVFENLLHVKKNIAACITHLAAMYNVLFMIMMSWMSSLCRCVLFLPGLWPTNAGYCFVSARIGQKMNTCTCQTYITVDVVLIALGFLTCTNLTAYISNVCWVLGQISAYVSLLDEKKPTPQLLAGLLPRP